MQTKPEPESFESQAVKHAINKLLTQEVFDISVVQKLSTVLRIPLEGSDYHSLILLAGTKYAEMSPDLRQGLQDKVLSLLKLEDAVLTPFEVQNGNVIITKGEESQRHKKFKFWGA